MALPELTDEQKRQALKKAQEVRSKRAQIRARLKKARWPWRGSCKCWRRCDRQDESRISLGVVAQDRQGQARQIMEEIGIDENRRVQGLASARRRPSWTSWQ